MNWLPLALGIVGVVAIALAVRGARRRTAALDASLDEALRRRLSEGLSFTDRQVALSATGAAISRDRLRTSCRRWEDVDAVATAATQLLGQPLQPMKGPLSLKHHGTRISIHFISRPLLDLLPREPRLAHRPEPDLDLVATYRVDGRADQCLSEDQLREQTIDTTDVHGIALAVLRQRFDERLAENLANGESETIESDDGSAATTVMVLADFLPQGAAITALVESADRVRLGTVGPAETTASGTHRVRIDAGGWKVL